MTAYAVDTVNQLDASPATARYRYYPGDLPPTLLPNLASPTDGTAFTESRIFVSGRAEDDIAIAEVEVAIVNAAGQYMSSSGTLQQQRALGLGVPEQPRLARLELLLHHADHP